MLNMARINPSITGVFTRGRSQDFGNHTTASINSAVTSVTREVVEVAATPLRLFENFVVVSAVEGNQKMFEPKVVLSYPVLEKIDRVSAIEGYCFPHGVTTKIIKNKEEAKQ
jgi:hypothetical protein